MREDTKKYLEWKRRYVDNHNELSIMDTLSSQYGTLVKTSSGDKNIKPVGDIPGKKVIEADYMKERNKLLDRFIHDTLELRSEDILKVDYKELLRLAIQSRPKVIEGKMEHEYTFSDMVKNASRFEKDLKRAEENLRNTVDVEYKAEQ